MAVLIDDALIVTMDPHIGIAQGSILIDDGFIQAVFPSRNGRKCEQNFPPAEQVVNGKGKIVIPGMVNAHYHSYANLLKGTVNDFPLEIWSLYTVAYGHSLDDEDMRLAVLLGAAEMIRSGITSCIDHFPHLSRAEVALSAYEESGMRVMFAPMLQDIPDYRFLPISLPQPLIDSLKENTPWSLKRFADFFNELITRWHGKHGKIQIALGPNAPQRCSEELLCLCGRLSTREGLNVHTHLLETELQGYWGRKVFQDGLLGLLERTGLLHRALSVAHAIWLDDEEIRLLQDKGVKIVHNPASNMLLGSGRMPLTRYFAENVILALGTDASNCGGPHNMFETMRLALMLQRLGEPDYRRWLHAEDVWRMATIGGAAVMGLDSQIGSISPGKRADLVLLRTDTTSWSPQTNIISQLVHHEIGGSIDSVMIDGKWVMKEGEILTFDEKKIVHEAQVRLHEMMERCKAALSLAGALQPFFEEMYLRFRRSRNRFEKCYKIE